MQHGLSARSTVGGGEPRFQHREEAEQLLLSLETLRRSAHRVYTLHQEFERLATVAQSNVGTAQALCEDINQLAHTLDLSLLPVKVPSIRQIKAGSIKTLA